MQLMHTQMQSRRRYPHRVRLSILVFPVAFSFIGIPSTANATDTDPWLGPDKAKHFGACAVLAVGGYSIGTVSFEVRWPRLLLGGGIALSAGVGKEIYDAMGYGNPSARDLVWDLIGTGFGLALAWTVDVLLSGEWNSASLFTQARGAELAIRF